MAKSKPNLLEQTFTVKWLVGGGPFFHETCLMLEAHGYLEAALHSLNPELNGVLLGQVVERSLQQMSEQGGGVTVQLHGLALEVYPAT